MTAAPVPSGADVDAWTDELDRLERSVAEVEAALDAGTPVAPSAWSPPTSLGPFPAALRDRVEDLLGRVHDLADEVRDVRSASVGEAQRIRQRRDAAAAYHRTG